MKLILAALAVPAAVLLASPASATPADFENAVREQGINIGMMVFNPGGVAASGVETCNRLRNGHSSLGYLPPARYAAACTHR